MIRNEYDEQQICQRHNLPLEFVNPDKSKPNQLYVCNQCIIEFYQPIPIQQIQQSNQSIINQFEEQLDQNSKIWDITIHSLISLRQDFIKSINIIENIIDAIRNQIQQATNEFKNMNVNHKEGIQQAHDSYLQAQLNHQRNIIQQIEILKQNSAIDKLIQGLNEINLQKLNQDDQQQKIKIEEIQKKKDKDQVVPLNSLQQLKAKRYEYQLIPNSSIKQEESCYAIALNYDGSIIVAGCERIIQIFKFKNNKLNKVQSLEGHNEEVFCLKFMKKSNQFISGSSDKTIKIWKGNNLNKYINIQTLEGHQNWINCLIINSNDDLIVSGSYDKSIIFWELNNNKWRLDQKIECSSSVYSLNFNDSMTKLISCQESKLIQVFEQQGKEWIIFQKIQVKTRGLRLCFISDNQFVFLPCQGGLLHFYILDLQSNQFKIQLEVEVGRGQGGDFGFPIKFIKSKNLLIVKHYLFIHIFRKQGDENFNQDQSIKIQAICLQGDASEDGNFMVTWDSITKEYQVRYLKEIQ